MITDDQGLKSAKTEGGFDIPVYDDGFGPLYIVRDSMGTVGIVRATDRSSAYSIAADEFFPEADETVTEMIKEFGDDFSENEVWNEQYGFRPNGPNHTDKIGHGIYAKDMNGDFCYQLTESKAGELHITLELEDKL